MIDFEKIDSTKENNNMTMCERKNEASLKHASRTHVGVMVEKKIRKTSLK